MKKSKSNLAHLLNQNLKWIGIYTLLSQKTSGLHRVALLYGLVISTWAITMEKLWPMAGLDNVPPGHVNPTPNATYY